MIYFLRLFYLVVEIISIKYVIFQVPFLGHRDGVGGTGGSENGNFPLLYVLKMALRSG